jgi:hypothetical protein
MVLVNFRELLFGLELLPPVSAYGLSDSLRLAVHRSASPFSCLSGQVDTVVRTAEASPSPSKLGKSEARTVLGIPGRPPATAQRAAAIGRCQTSSKFLLVRLNHRCELDFFEPGPLIANHFFS